MTSVEMAVLLARMEERQKADSQLLEDILEQCRRTNGRVTSLEHTRSRQSGIWFAVICVTPVIGAAVGYVVTYFFH